MGRGAFFISPAGSAPWAVQGQKPAAGWPGQAAGCRVHQPLFAGETEKAAHNLQPGGEIPPAEQAAGFVHDTPSLSNAGKHSQDAREWRT